MDKKSIIGIAVVAVLFLGFAYLNTKEQKKYEQEMAAWQATQDSLAAVNRAAAVAADTTAVIDPTDSVNTSPLPVRPHPRSSPSRTT